MWLEVLVAVGEDTTSTNVFLVELPNYTSIRSTYTIIGTLIEERFEMFSAFAKAIEFFQDKSDLDALVVEMIDRYHIAYDLCCNKDRLLQNRRALHTNFLQQEIIAMKEATSRVIPVSDVAQQLLKNMDKIEKAIQKKLNFELLAFDKPILVEDAPSQDKNDKRRPYEKRLCDYFGKNDKTKLKIRASVSEPLILLQDSPKIIDISNQYFSSRTSPLSQNKRKAEEIVPDADDAFFSGVKRRKNYYEPKERTMGRRRLRIAEDLALRPQQLEYIGMSNVVRDKVKFSDELKQQILQVDTAYDRESKLDQLMQMIPDFTVFCNELLFIMGEKELTEVYPPKNTEEEEELIKIIKKSVS